MYDVQDTLKGVQKWKKVFCEALFPLMFQFPTASSYENWEGSINHYLFAFFNFFYSLSSEFPLSENKELLLPGENAVNPFIGST